MSRVFLLIMVFTSITVAGLPQGQVLHLDGEGDYVYFSDPLINTTTFTIEVWANTFAHGKGQIPQNPLFQQRDDATTSGFSKIFLATEIPEKTASFVIQGSLSPSQRLLTAAAPLRQWHHYAAVVDSDSVSLYIDGELRVREMNHQSGDYTTSIDYIDIGRHRYKGENWGFFNGTIDEMRIWNHGRTQKQILDHMNDSLSVQYPATTDSGLVAYYRFDTPHEMLVDDTLRTGIKDWSLSRQHGLFKGNSRLVRAQPAVIPIKAFDLIFPPNDTTIKANEVEFIWSSAVKEEVFYSEELCYTFYFDTSIDFDSPDSVKQGVDTTLVLSRLAADSTWFWKVKAQNYGGETLWSSDMHGFFLKEGFPTAVAEQRGSPKTAVLMQNYPNPFNASTSISFSLSRTTDVRLVIYNLRGERVRTLVDEPLPAGSHRLLWNGTDRRGNRVPSGVYLYKLDSNRLSEMKKLLLVK